ncbi:peptidase inhibitor family I36 protein [Streptomyces sp. NPDC020898]|uniref:peptidase inhibitor family I36 protein n=1 Tax=Streptomyces sp. NPDC020898 TaxID=3365101 RepID=UPI0037A1CFCD
MSVVKRFASVAAAAVTLLALGMTGPASAGTAQADAAFGGQARAAGLSQEQADALQAKVEGLLARQDGRQVSANEISLGDGATLLVSVPGEKYARDLTSPVGTRAAAAWECSYEYFCMYRGQNGTGNRLALYNCQNYALSNWEGLGSWWNNQTPGTRAQFKNQSGGVIFTTPGASSWDGSYNWTPVWYVKPC